MRYHRSAHFQEIMEALYDCFILVIKHQCRKTPQTRMHSQWDTSIQSSSVVTGRRRFHFFHFHINLWSFLNVLARKFRRSKHLDQLINMTEMFKCMFPGQRDSLVGLWNGSLFRRRSSYKAAIYRRDVLCRFGKSLLNLGVLNSEILVYGYNTNSRPSVNMVTAAKISSHWVILFKICNEAPESDQFLRQNTSGGA